MNQVHYNTPRGYVIPFSPYPVVSYPYYANVRTPVYYSTGYGGWNYSSPLAPNPLYDVEAASRSSSVQPQPAIEDQGTKPFVVNIEQVTKANDTYRTAIWTGKHFQVTVMSINVGDDIGLEVHPHTDQFIRIEQGQGLVQMGDSKDRLDFHQAAQEGDAIMVPAGKWHNVTNTGNVPLKVYVIYAPPEHPFGTVHVTKADAMSSGS